MFQNLIYFSEKDFLFFFLFSVTRLEKYMFIVFFCILLIFFLSLKSVKIVPEVFQSFIEALYEFLMLTLNQQAGKLSQKMFPFFFLLFIFILFSNVIGLIPFSFTITSHIFQTFSIGLSV